MTEKLASTEIAQSRERFEKVALEAVSSPKECSHGEETWYCDSCKYEWEKALVGRVADALEQAERDTRERCAQFVEAEDIDELIKQPFSLAEIWQALAERIRGKVQVDE